MTPGGVLPYLAGIIAAVGGLIAAFRAGRSGERSAEREAATQPEGPTSPEETPPPAYDLLQRTLDNLLDEVAGLRGEVAQCRSREKRTDRTIGSLRAKVKTLESSLDAANSELAVLRGLVTTHRPRGS